MIKDPLVNFMISEFYHAHLNKKELRINEIICKYFKVTEDSFKTKQEKRKFFSQKNRMFSRRVSYLISKDVMQIKYRCSSCRRLSLREKYEHRKIGKSDFILSCPHCNGESKIKGMERSFELNGDKVLCCPHRFLPKTNQVDSLLILIDGKWNAFEM